MVIFPLGQPNLEEAMDKLLNSSGGDLLTNVTIRHYNHSFILGVSGYEVEADVWRMADSEESKNADLYELKTEGEKSYLVSIKNSSNIIKIEKKRGIINEL